MLRGRAPGEVPARLRQGLLAAGLPAARVHEGGDEAAAAAALLDAAAAGDVLVRDELARAGFEHSIAAGIVLTGGSAKMDGVIELAEEGTSQRARAAGGRAGSGTPRGCGDRPRGALRRRRGPAVHDRAVAGPRDERQSAIVS